jgi:hypothetical protein
MRAAPITPIWSYAILTGDEAVEHCRTLGAVRSVEGHEALVVEVVRRDELSPAGGGAVADRGAARVLVGGVRVTASAARRLAALLAAAADLTDGP